MNIIPNLKVASKISNSSPNTSLGFSNVKDGSEQNQRNEKIFSKVGQRILKVTVHIINHIITGKGFIRTKLCVCL